MRKTVVTFLIAFMAIAAAPPSAPAQQLIRVGYSGTGVAKNLHKTIERAGLWKKRGLDVRLIYFTSGATMAQAMVGGDLEIADSDVPAMLNAVSAGALDGKLISVYINRFPFAFVVRNDIKTPEDLKGKQIAISRFGSSSDVTTRMLLRQYNIDPDKDVRIIQAAGTTRVPAMIAGQLHGTLLGTYDVPVITDSGCCRVMVDMLGTAHRLRPLRPSGTDPTSAHQARTVDEIRRGVDRRHLRLQDQQRVSPCPYCEPRAVKGPEYSYPRIAAAMRERPIPEAKGVQAVMDSVQAANSKVTQAKDVMDGSLIEEIDRSGYIKKLYGK